MVRALLILCALPLLPGCGTGEASGTSAAARQAKPPAPVEVADVERGAITLRRTFSGTLEASASVTIASRVTGQLERLDVDIGDRVSRGQVIAALADEDLEQEVLQADADLAVARATKEQAAADAEFARRALERMDSLGEDGIASQSELDAAKTAARARDAAVQVADARVQRAEALVESARLRRAEANIVAGWESAPPDPAGGGDETGDTRVVAERFVDEGTLVTAGTPVVSVVALDPIVAVVFAPERDYARLAVGQEAVITTDAYPGASFSGVVARIAPVFSRTTRQVRVELECANEDLRLKPGMFVRATLRLATEEGATVVPFAALTERGGATGVFEVDRAKRTARWVPVVPGIREGARVAVTSELALDGPVVTLGQELCEDGGPVVVPDTGR